MARKLSAVKAFYRWLAEREGFEPTAVLSTRAPKFQKKLPRPLAVDAAQRDDRHRRDTVRPAWVAARDVAVLTLLWGCGLRISEALGLTGADAPLPDVLRIVGKGGKERVVPVLPAARDGGRRLSARFALIRPQPDAPLFRAIRGGALGPARFQQVMAQRADATGPARHRHAPRHAPQLCHPSAGRRRRSARDSGTCWAMPRSRPRRPIRPSIPRG